MNTEALALSINRVSNAIYGNIHTYVISVVYGITSWEVHHRFSEFWSLYEILINNFNFDGIPIPPSKTITRPQDPVILEERRILLESWLSTLCSRVDIRTSFPFLDFIEFDKYTNIEVKPLLPSLVTASKEELDSLTDFVFIDKNQTVIATFEENIGLSRVGKVWSLIETEESGCINQYQLQTSKIASVSSRDDSFKNPLNISLNKINQMISSNRFHSFFYHENTNRIFVGLDSGNLEIYSVVMLDSSSDTFSNISQRYSVLFNHFIQYDADKPLSYTIVKESSLPLHNEAIVSVKGTQISQGKVLTVGYDKAIRLLNCSTLEPISGGKLTKRLISKERLTIGIIEDNDEIDFFKSRLFVGTSCGRIFIYSSSINPPEYRFCIQCNQKASINALEMVKSNLIIGNKYDLLIYKIGPVGLESETQLISRLVSPLTSGRTIHSIVVSDYTPLLFLGHSYSITVWNCYTNSCVACFRAHSSGVVRLTILPVHMHKELSGEDTLNPYNTIFLLSGGGGMLKIWHFTCLDQYVEWKPKKTNIDDTLPNHSIQKTNNDANNQVIKDSKSLNTNNETIHSTNATSKIKRPDTLSNDSKKSNDVQNYPSNQTPLTINNTDTFYHESLKHSHFTDPNDITSLLNFSTYKPLQPHQL